MCVYVLMYVGMHFKIICNKVGVNLQHVLSYLRPGRYPSVYLIFWFYYLR